MQFKRILSIALVLSLSFVLAACGGGAATPAAETEAATTDGADTEATEAAEDTETETGDGEEAGSSDLPESASASVTTGGTLTVNYPSGWTATPVEGAGSIALVGSDATQNVSVTYLPEATGADAAAVLEMQSSAVTMAGGTASEVTTTDNGSSMTITVAGVESTYYVAAIDGGYVYLTGMNVDAATLEAIAASASFSN